MSSVLSRNGGILILGIGRRTSRSFGVRSCIFFNSGMVLRKVRITFAYRRCGSDEPKRNTAEVANDSASLSCKKGLAQSMCFSRTVVFCSRIPLLDVVRSGGSPPSSPRRWSRSDKIEKFNDSIGKILSGLVAWICAARNDLPTPPSPMNTNGVKSLDRDGKCRRNLSIAVLPPIISFKHGECFR